MTTRVFSGAGCAEMELPRLWASKSALVVVDEGAGFDASALTGADLTVETIRVERQGLGVEDIRGLMSRIDLADPEIIVAIGGGSLMDAVKVAALSESRDGLLELFLQRSRRAGLIVAGSTAVRRRALALVPTTLGTSSEVNSTATLNTDSGRKLILGEALRPDVAVLDSKLTGSLPQRLVAEGAMEAFLRVAGVFAWASRERSLEGTAVEVARAIIVASMNASQLQDQCLELGRLSGYTHTSGALTSATPYPMKHWYIANELSFVTNLRKIQATAPLIGPVWRRIMSGDYRFGSRSALESFWNQVADLVPGQSRDPAAGFGNFAQTLGVETHFVISAQDIAITAKESIRNWGGRLPMLSGLTVSDIESLLREAERSAAG